MSRGQGSGRTDPAGRHLTGRHLVGRQLVGRQLMGQPPAAVTGLVRLTVMSSTRRVDLALPSAVPVAELVPELARRVGLLDARTVYAGYRLVTHEGRVLSADSGLTTQGVQDGAVLTVASGVEDRRSPVYDDVVEAMAEAVQRDLDPWDATAARQAALWAGAALMLTADAALLFQHGSDVAAAAGVVAAVTLVLGGVAVSRVQRENGAALTLALVGSGHAAMAGLLLAWSRPSFGSPLVAGGAGALVAGSVAALGVDRGSSLLLPPVVVGGVFAGAGLLTHIWSYDPAAGLTTVLALVVMGGSVFPWLALGSTNTGVERLFSAAVLSDDPDEIDPAVVDPSETDPHEFGAHEIGPGGVDPERIAADAQVAHEILVGLAATVGLLLVLVAPSAVSLGPAGALVSVLACAVVMLRVRRYHSRTEVLVGLASGVLGLMATALSVLCMHPAWRPVATAALAVTGGAFLARSRVPPRTLVRRGALGDLAESVALLALPPTLVTAIGVLSWVRG